MNSIPWRVELPNSTSRRASLSVQVIFARLLNQLGGGWPALIGNGSYDNTCTVRLSVALIEVGQLIPSDLAQADGGHKDAQGRNMIVKVPTAKRLLERLLGPSTWGTSKAIGTDIADGSIPAWTGFLLYLVPIGDASGHVDLWNKDHCTLDCHNTFARAASTVEVWSLA
jgi:hypothetical protein